jgi:ADP-ribose pyrophosphatase YjhB (NUDIX family)
VPAVDCEIHKLVADVALVAEGHVLFVKYRDTSSYDGQSGWFLPDDFLAHGEHPDEAARRIATEQTGQGTHRLRLAEIESFGGRKAAWHLVFHYLDELEERREVEPRGNVAEARWFALDSLPEAHEVAHHGWGLDTLQRVLPETVQVS